MKNTFKFLGILIAMLFLLSSCTQNKDLSMQQVKAMPDNNVAENQDDGMLKETDKVMPETENNDLQNNDMQKYSGNLLAGSSSPYLIFNQADYEKASAQGKTILLYFYASWCPSCRAEQPKIIEAFNSLESDNFVGFRVGYKDGESELEKMLAKEFQIPYQHTKVIIRNSELLLKSPESWDSSRYIAEFSKIEEMQ